MNEKETEVLVYDVKSGLEFFLSPNNSSKRMDFKWGTIYWTGTVVRVDIKDRRLSNGH